MQVPPLISIIIPTYNGSYWLESSLSAIFDQNLSNKIEVIIIDSGSKDNSIDIVKKFPTRLYQIDKETFNHGETRNMGVQLAKGVFVVMTVQDAIPVNRYWLKELLAGFVDEDVAGVCGQQIVPHKPEYNPFEWFRPQSPPKLMRYQFPSSNRFDCLSPAEKKNICRWDNVNAIYRRALLLKYPFRVTDFAEDAGWAQDILRQGLGIVYNPAAQVHHFHFHTPDYTYRRSFFVYYHLYILFNHIPFPKQTSMYHTLSKLKTLILRTPGLSIAEKIKWWQYQSEKEKARKRATDDFINYLKEGEDKLQKVYVSLRERIPIALSTEKNG